MLLGTNTPRTIEKTRAYDIFGHDEMAVLHRRSAKSDIVRRILL